VTGALLLSLVSLPLKSPNLLLLESQEQPHQTQTKGMKVPHLQWLTLPLTSQNCSIHRFQGIRDVLNLDPTALDRHIFVVSSSLIVHMGAVLTRKIPIIPIVGIEVIVAEAEETIPNLAAAVICSVNTIVSPVVGSRT